MAFELPRESVMNKSTIAARLNASAEAATGNKAAAVRRLEFVDDEEMSGGGARAAYDVFINHRGVDTKHNVARLLYDRLEHLSRGRVRSFLDNKSMRPGDRLVERINEGIRQCKVGVAIFSEHYFDSDFCLDELASLVEARKVIIPIFYGIKPSELILPHALVESNTLPPREIERIKLALHQVKYTVGLTYDPATGDLAELVSTAASAVMERIQEAERVPRRQQMIASRL